MKIKEKQEKQENEENEEKKIAQDCCTNENNQATSENIGFESLGLNQKVLDSIKKLGFDEPSQIQKKVIPLILKGEDVIGKAQTGTGKTLAYTSCVISMQDVPSGVIRSIVLVPTRELAIQVSKDFESVNKMSGFRILPVYGGSDIQNQIKSLKKGTDILVGTPGRIIDLIKRKYIDLDNVTTFILDEADEMLDMGFLEDIEYIFDKTNIQKQVMLFSATMPESILNLAKKYMSVDYKFVEIKEKSKTSVNVYQTYYLVNDKQRLEAMCRILDIKNAELGIIFCKTKRECDEILAALQARNYSAEAMHGDIAQSMRIQTLDRFKKHAFNYLVATDVAARGIHVDNVDIVVNYRIPQDVESYIHRIGRTGRAKNKGEAITLITPKELKFISQVEKIAKCSIEEKQLPSYNDVFSSKYERIIEKAKENSNSKENAKFIEYVRDMNKADLINLSSGLFKLLIDKEIGADFNKSIAVKEKKQRGIASNKTRLFLTIGKMDKLRKPVLIDFIKRKANVDEEKISNIEILEKFTFVDVDSKVADKIIKNLFNTKLNNRIIRVEKSKSSSNK